MHWVRPAELMEKWHALDVRIAPPLIPMLQEMAAAADEPFDGIAARLHALNERMEAEGPHIEFVPDVLTLLVKTPTLPPATHTNCYVVGSRELLIVDPGSADVIECARVSSLVRRRQADGARAVAIVLTHHHGDHVGGAAPLAAELDLPVWAHERTWERWGEGAALRRREGSRALADGDVLELSGGERFDVLHTPGHAAGHLALLERKHGSLFSGDLVSGVSTILVDSAPGSMDAYLASLERIRDLDARTLFPGHGFPFIAPAKGVQRVIDHRLEREEKIAAALADGPLDLAEVVRRAYADTPRANPALAAAQAECHLERLERSGRVGRTGGLWKATR
jgi:glyoxylase-like metal-dependent hydrolase (beta-lactamase superfamily II)